MKCGGFLHFLMGFRSYPPTSWRTFGAQPVRFPFLPTSSMGYAVSTKYERFRLKLLRFR